MSGGAEYDDQLDCYEGEETPGQLAARRTRRRRRHGKKQGFPSPEVGFADREARYGREAQYEEYKQDRRGRWLPPASATSLTLAQLGIHLPANRDNQAASRTLSQLGMHGPPPVPPPRLSAEAQSRNVVTLCDLDLFDCVGKTSQSLGALDIRRNHPQPSLMQQHQAPPSWHAEPNWGLVEERPWERILSVPSPQAALNLVDSIYRDGAMAHYQVPQSPHHHMQPPTWSTEPPPQTGPTWSEPDPRHWLCSGQYGAQPVFHNPICDSNGMPLSAAPPAPLAAPACTTALLEATTPAGGTVAIAPTGPAASENTKLETLLQNLAAEAYQD